MTTSKLLDRDALSIMESHLDKAFQSATDSFHWIGRSKKALLAIESSARVAPLGGAIHTSESRTITTFQDLVSDAGDVRRACDALGHNTYEGCWHARILLDEPNPQSVVMLEAILSELAGVYPSAAGRADDFLAALVSVEQQMGPDHEEAVHCRLAQVSAHQAIDALDIFGDRLRDVMSDADEAGLLV